MQYILSESLRKKSGLSSPRSIYPYAPVFSGYYQGQKVILKKTRSPLVQAHCLQNWLKPLKQQSVHSLHLFSEEEDIWVMYPFIEGEPYIGSLTQCESAGELLGKIHSLPSVSLPRLILERPDLTEEQDGLAQLRKKGYLNSLIEANLLKLLNQAPQLFEQLYGLQLPEVTATWDYKANNLIFTHDGPVLIDPDSSGNLPRLFDLALACLLFHNEITPHNKVWSELQWQAFLKGYRRHISLTAEEHSVWTLAKKWMYLDEVLWLLFSAEETEWKNDVQGTFLRDLMALNIEESFLL